MTNKKSASGNKKPVRTAITPTRAKDYPNWYQAVVRESELAEMAHVRGCMVIRPWGYGIWENIQTHLGRQIKAHGHENAYFPLFVPLSYIEKEAEHVEGFAKEMAVVTHHRLERKGDSLVPASPLTEPLVVRPTSETIIGESMSRWISSYRDLPMRINQWCNVVRWEMRPRVFLRTTEFLWQEGHTAHSTEAEAQEEVSRMLELYRSFTEDWLAIPVIPGNKPAYDRFPGAKDTQAIEAMMQDGKALQAGTSHYLGTNFSKSANIKFVDDEGAEQLAFTTSWGVSTRLIGGVIMTHGDDDGLRLPPRISPLQVVVVPIQRKDPEENERTIEYSRALCEQLNKQSFGGGISVEAKLDDRDDRATVKRWKWIKRGVPIVVELGPRDNENQTVSYVLRNDAAHSSNTMEREKFVDQVGTILDGIQSSYFEDAATRLRENTRTDIGDFEALENFFKDDNPNPGFVRAFWKPTEEADARLKKYAVTIRCIPFDKQLGEEGPCVLSGETTSTEAIFAKSY